MAGRGNETVTLELDAGATVMSLSGTAGGGPLVSSAVPASPLAIGDVSPLTSVAKSSTE